MALTQVSTGGVKDDAVTVDKMASNSVGSSQIINSGVLQDDIANQAVNADKIANNTITQAKIANDAVGADQLASNAVVTASIADDAITQAKINIPISNRNLIINGAMLVAQRGTSSQSTGYGSVDRFRLNYGGTDQNPTQSQGDVASGTTPYTEGFRKTFRVTNANQTSGADTTDHISFDYRTEAQDIANSGWNYTSTSSYITVSYWVKSSVSQNFFVRLLTKDGTNQRYAFETGTLAANTWTKITKTISGASSLQFDNNNGDGLQFRFYLFRGSANTDNGVTLNQWQNHNGNQNTPDQTSTWYTTNNATFEITGLQLEVGSVATDFEHRSFGQELALCQRYYEENNCTWAGFTAAAQGNGSLQVDYKVTKRAVSTLTTKTAANGVQNLTSQNLQDATLDRFVVDTRINSSGYGRFYDLLAASDAEL